MRLAISMLSLSVSALALACSTSPASTAPTSGEAALAETHKAEAGHHEAGHHEAGHDSGTCAAEGHQHGEHHASAGDREHVDADGVVRRGAPLTTSLIAMPVSAAFTNAKDLNGQKVKLTGKVNNVCQKMGCWFVVQGDKPEDHIRISTKAHNIFVPKSSIGMSATVEGTLLVKTLSAAAARHFEDERALAPGETRKTITTDVTEIGIDVTGLELSKS